MHHASSHHIVLTTLNARYMHTAFGLRYLYANIGELKAVTTVEEYTIQQRPIDIAEKLLTHEAKIIGIGVYIWNLTEVTRTVELLKQVSPDTVVVLGGPEVSHPPDLPAVCEIADYVVTGSAEKSFRELCVAILSGYPPVERLIRSEELPLEALVLPYEHYTDEDIRNRLIYVEASRGCPYKCEFCLSSLDKTAKPFELSGFLHEMDKLYQRGVRNFKFIDRTFNLKLSSSITILEFFLDKITDDGASDLYLHFEVVPDKLPDRLKVIIQQFPENALQFEIGVQTFDENIQSLISRKQDNEKTIENLTWLRQHSHVYIHADLIFGLPADTLDNFADSFDRLVALDPHEIQLGILKRLRGAPLNRHNEMYGIRYNPEPPYNVLCTSDIEFATMQRVNRFARYWDMIANSGRFRHTLPLVLGSSAFCGFMQLSDDLYRAVGSTWKISLKRLFRLLYQILQVRDDIEEPDLVSALHADYERCNEKENFESVITGQDKVARIGLANRRQLARL